MVCLCYLQAQRQANARARFLCGVEWHKEVGSTGNSGPLVFNRHFHVLGALTPTDLDRSPRLQCRIHCVVNEVDEQLIELITIGHDGDVRTLGNLYRQTGLETCDAFDPSPHIEWFEHGGRQASQPGIRSHEATEGLGT